MRSAFRRFIQGFGFGRRAAGKARRAAVKPPRFRPWAMALEDRLLLSVTPTWVNDNWNLIADNGDNVLSLGDTLQNDNDTLNPGAISVIYGTDGFGTVTTSSVGGIGGIPGSVTGAATINDAVAETTAGGALNVLEGTYVENVNVNKSLTVRGARFGVDARTRTGVESIVDGDGVSAAFAINADDVIIDGFTIQGGQNVLNSGVWVSSATADHQIINNIITDNQIGVFAQAGGAMLIEKNLFDANNRPGASGGAAIYTDSSQDLTISKNDFLNHTENNPIIFGTVAAPSHLNLIVTENVFDNEFGVFALGIDGGTFSRNTFTTNEATALSFSGGNSGIDVLENIFVTNARAIRVQDFGFGLGDDSDIEAHSNDFGTNSDFAVGVIDGYTGTFDASGNWWSDASGPTIASNPDGVGETINDPNEVVDYSPWLNTGTDISPGTAGFQGDFSKLTVNTGSPINDNQTVGNLQDGIDQLTAGGTLTVLAGTYEESVTVNKAATIQGATGVAADVVVNPLVGNGIAITANGVTLKDLSVTGAVNGIVAVNVAAPTLENVDSSNNTDDGFQGTNLTGTFTVTDSTFNDNGGDGLDLTNVADVVFTGVTATGNDPGVLINGGASFSDTDGNFSNNNDYGIFLIDIAGDVTLVRTTADNNDADNDGDGDGLYAEDGADADDNAIGGNLLVQGARFRDTGGLNDHQENGVFIQGSVAAAGVGGNVTFEDSAGPAQSVIVTGNEADGVFIDGAVGGTFTNGTYSSNGDDGLDLSGFVSLDVNGVTANLNGSDGLEIGATTNVSISASTFSNNGAFGFNAFDLTLLTLSDLTLAGNSDEGGTITNVTVVDYTTSTGNVADTLIVESDRLERTVPAQQRILYSAVTTMDLNTLGGGDTINILSTAAGTIYTVNAGNGNDVITVGSDPATPASSNINGILGAITVNGDAPASPPGDRLIILDRGNTAGTYTITGTAFQRAGTALITYATIEGFRLEASNQADTIDVLSTLSTTVYQVDGNAGADTIRVGSTPATPATSNLNGIQGALTVNGNAPASPASPGDRLGFFDQGNAVGGTYEITSTTFQRAGTALVTYGTIETFGLEASNQPDTINVLSTNGGTVYVIGGNAGADTINIGSTPGTPATSNLNGIQGALTVNGNAPAFPASPGDTLNILDQGNTAGTYTVTATTVQRTGTALITYGTIETFVLQMSNQGDTTNIISTNAGTTTTVNGNDGNDVFNVGSDPVTPSNSNLNGIQGTLIINGNAHNATPTSTLTVCDTVTNTLPVGDTVNFLDAGLVGGSTYTLNATTLARTGITTITFNTIETVNLNTGNGLDTINLTTTGASTTTTVNSNGGADFTTITTTGSSSNTIFNGGAGDDDFILNSAGANALVQLNGDDGIDEFLVTAVPATSAVELNGGANNDTFHLGSDLNPLASTLDNLLGDICIDGDGHDAMPTLSVSIVAAAGASVSITLPLGDVVNYNDGADANNNDYFLTGTSLARGSVHIDAEDVETVNLTAGVGTDTIDAVTADSVTTGIQTTAGGDTVNLTTGATALVGVTGDALANTITVRGTGGGSVTGLLGGAGDDTFNVRATGLGSGVGLSGEADNDTANLGNTANSLDELLGIVGTDGGPHTSGDTINFNDQGDTSNNDYLLTDETFQRSGTAIVGYINWEILNLNAGLGDDVIRIHDTVAGTLNQIFANDGNDRIQLCETHGETDLYGQNGNDEFAFADQGTLSGGIVDGGTGVNLLNYHDYQTTVSVNLTAGTATGTAGIANIQNVVGGQAADLLIGDGNSNQLEGRNGADQMYGQGGNDILFGELGEDNMNGGEGDDYINGGMGSDNMAGGNGNDWIEGEAGNDNLFGENGDDLLVGGVGGDFLSGGLGFDTIAIDNCCDVLLRIDRIDMGGVGANGGVIVLVSTLDLSGRPSQLNAFAGDVCDDTPPSGPGEALAAASPDTDFIQSLYVRFLGRAAGSGEVGGWTSLLARGLSREQVVHAFMNSEEGRGYFVKQLYLQHLGRVVDAGGQAAWVAAMKGGLSREIVESALLASDEYFNLQGGTAAFIDSLYLAFLGRHADQPGLDAWTQSLAQGLSRQQVAERIMRSTEAHSFFVSNLYLNILGRSPDLDGLSAWINALNHGASRQAVMVAFVASVEYYQNL